MKCHYAGFKNNARQAADIYFLITLFVLRSKKLFSIHCSEGCRSLAVKGKLTGRRNCMPSVLYLKREFAFHIPFLKAALVYGEPLLTSNNKKIIANTHCLDCTWTIFLHEFYI
uniref:Uncharacterized protein n=1 Tax=Rhipicephalus zambeziensis TaxID=60191 RepID=A0A224YAX4_9ACAR